LRVAGYELWVAVMNYPCNLISGIRNPYSVICHPTSDLCNGRKSPAPEEKGFFFVLSISSDFGSQAHLPRDNVITSTRNPQHVPRTPNL